MASTTTSTTTQFKTSIELRTQKASAQSIASNLPDANTNPNEARYWFEKFGLGKKTMESQHRFAHFRQATLQAGSASVVHQLLFVPASTEEKHVALATVCGPRV